jgi:hypothetical protein
MARRCTTVPGYGFCCASMQQYGQARAAQGVTSPNGKHCISCTVMQKKKSRCSNPNTPAPLGFRVRMVANAQCGIGAGGCPGLTPGMLAGAGAPAYQVQGFQGGFQVPQIAGPAF